MRCYEGEYTETQIPVLTNVFDIPRRLKEIRPSFFVMFNMATQKYEIHDSEQPDSSLACTLPFDELDARALEYARKYSAARFAQTVREVDEHNDRLERDAHKAHLDQSNYKMAEAVTYLNRHERAEQIPQELIDA